jgi:hypothetical protein
VSRLRDHDHDVSDVVLFDPPPTRQRWAAADLLRLLIGVVSSPPRSAASFADETIAGVEDDVVAGIGRLPDRSRRRSSAPPRSSRRSSRWS